MDQRVDIVIPVYNELEIIDQLYRRVTTTCEQLTIRWRVIFVDDGSDDGVSDWIRQNADRRHDVHLISLSRNFGQPAAIAAGLDQSLDADCVVLMDGDLQDPPELILDMVHEWLSGYEVVIPQRRRRQEALMRGLAFKTFHRLFEYLSDSFAPRNTGTFCLMNAQAVQAIRELPECHRFFPGLRAWVGFRQRLLPFDRPARAGGEPKQSFPRLLKYGLDAIFGYSLKPLRLLTCTGLMICLLSFGLACWFLAKRAMGIETASIGFTTLTCAIFGLGGFQLVGLGILGEYVGRIYEEVKRRPQYVVAEHYRSQDDAVAGPRIAA